jgi:hypothetical protein
MAIERATAIQRASIWKLVQASRCQSQRASESYPLNVLTSHAFPSGDGTEKLNASVNVPEAIPAVTTTRCVPPTPPVVLQAIDEVVTHVVASHADCANCSRGE